MYLIYADESGNTGTDLSNKQQPMFVLGSLIINDTQWHNVNDYFNQKKIEIYNNFKNIEIHTNEIFNLPHKSIFHIKNWQENFKLLDSIVELILNLDITFQFIAINKLNLKKHLSVTSNTKIDPYIFAFSILYNYISKEFNNEKCILFLDELIEIPKTLDNLYPKISANNKTIIEKALFLKSKDTNSIQIVDVYSFYISQYLCINRNYKNYNEFKEKHCIYNYKKLMSKTTDKLILDFE